MALLPRTHLHGIRVTVLLEHSLEELASCTLCSARPSARGSAACPYAASLDPVAVNSAIATPDVDPSTVGSILPTYLLSGTTFRRL